MPNYEICEQKTRDFTSIERKELERLGIHPPYTRPTFYVRHPSFPDTYKTLQEARRALFEVLIVCDGGRPEGWTDEHISLYLRSYLTNLKHYKIRKTAL